MQKESQPAVGKKVRAFYEGCSFPGYEDFDTPQELIAKAQQGVYARLLDEQLPMGVRILDAGCGTGQLAIFLSIVHRRVVGIDFTYNSLHKGSRFKKRFELSNVSFAQMDLFQLGLREESFDYVFCKGVLHHTANAYAAFQNLCRLVKPNGYIIIGLYNTYARIPLHLRRLVFRITKDHVQFLDPIIRKKSIGADKKRIWFLDQYKNPHEDTYTVDQVLDWFRKNRFAYVNSIPTISPGSHALPSEPLFEPRSPSGPVGRILCQLGWMFQYGAEGGFFITIGRKS